MNSLDNSTREKWQLFNKSYREFGLCVDNHLERFQLSNGLEVLLVQNQKFKNSSVLMTVDAGAIYDPEDVNGLAHLTEHMIFQGSDKYTKKNELLDFVDLNSGSYNGSTSFEKMKFYIQINHKNFAKSCDILAHALASPALNNADCSKEIKIVDHEYQNHKTKLICLLQALFSITLDHSVKDKKFTVGSKETLNRPDIGELVREFHRKYFTSNRMQLIIASNLSFEDLREIANLFSIIPEGKLKNEAILTENLNFNDKYEIGSLIKEPTKIKLNDEFLNSLVKFNMKNKCEYLVINMNFQSELLYFETRIIHYIREYFKRNMPKFLKEEFGETELFQYITIDFYSTNNVTNFVIYALLKPDGKEKTNLILEKIRECLCAHKINKEFFDYIRENSKQEFKEPVDSLICVNIFENCLDLFSDANLEKYYTKYIFNEEVLNETFEKISDTKNWTVFQLVEDSHLPNKIPFFPIQYSDPVPLKLKPWEETDMTFEFENKTKISSQISLKENPSPKIQKKFIFNHLDHGEYILMVEDEICKNKCKVNISFVADYDIARTIEVELFMFAFQNKVKTILNEHKLDVTFLVNRLGIFEGNISVLGEKEQVIESLRFISDSLKSFEPNEIELKNAKKEYESFCSAFICCPLSSLALKVFSHSVMNCQFHYFKKNSCEKAKFYTDYYLKIQSFGNISENEIIDIYNQFKSAGTKSSIKKLCVSDKRAEYEILNNEDQLLLFGYNIDAEDSYTKNAICKILKCIFNRCFFNLFRSEHQASYLNQVICFPVSNKIFLTFMLQSNHDLSEIENIFMCFIKKYQEEIANISDKELEDIKFGICENIDFPIDSFDRLASFFNLTLSYGEFDFDFFEKLKKAIKLVTKEVLLNLNLGEAKPIIISSRNKCSQQQ